MKKKKNSHAAPRKLASDKSAARASVFRLPAQEIERRLVTGTADAELERYFGAQFEHLRTTAHKARAVMRSAGGARPKVLILPGIMGSMLGFKPVPFVPLYDTLWFDPLDVTLGRLSELALPSKKKIVALDPVPLVYTGLKLALIAAGFDADYFAYDWRLSLRESGAALKKKLDSMGPGRVHLAAHSMGGLVARAALKQGAGNIGTVVMMGTPNGGSYSPVLALRGVHELASIVAGIDQMHSGRELTEKIFSTFPGLAQMLPMDAISNGVAWSDAGIWPTSPRARKDVLAQAADMDSLLAAPRDDWHLIAGIDQETIERGEPDPAGGGFRYKRAFEGDGTVPLASARISGLERRTFYVKHDHTTLPMNLSVCRAVVELLRGGKVSALPSEMPQVRPALQGWITDAEIAGKPKPVSRAARAGKTKPSGLREGMNAMLRAMSLANVPCAMITGDGTLPLSDAAGGGGEPESRELLAVQPYDGMMVERDTRPYLELELAFGDIAQVEADAIVLAKFQNMDMGRAAQAVDAKMDGVLASVLQRRMFAANVGEMFVLPAGRHPLRADIVALAGMGPMDGFIIGPGRVQWDTLELVAENTLRTLMGAGVTEFATLLFGHVSDAGPEFIREGLAHFIQGFLRGLLDAKDADRRRFRRVILCEADEARFRVLKDSIHHLLRTKLFADVRVRIDERVLPRPDFFEHRTIGAAAAVASGTEGRDPAYLFVRAAREAGDLVFETTFASTLGKAATYRESMRVSEADLGKALAPVKPSSWDDEVSAAEVIKAGMLLTDLLLHPSIRAALEGNRESPLILVHDDEASRIPWETLRLGKDGALRPACAGGLTRQYAASNLSVAKFMEARRRDEHLRVLLIVNPTGDLAGAAEEGARIETLLAAHADVRVTVVREHEATRDRLLTLFRSGEFDVVHYAGHAFFEPSAPERSGIICAPKDENNPSVLSGADLAGLGQLPMLVFFNACESARVRGIPPPATKTKKRSDHPDRVRGLVSFAEAFMRGGVASFVGTYWPVGDACAKTFAETFYAGILDGLPLGPVMTNARKALTTLKPATGDWADYLHYGSPNFVLKPRR
ncbi:MAG: CHAT domain-containing protein [Verrucomicrobiaceae bacterium]|nr:CHAT domain-containing protein [Verrucomicrobiaceae bacterium]